MRLITFLMTALVIVNGAVAQLSSPKYLGEGNEHNCFIISEEGDYWFNVAHLNNPKNAFVLWNENGEMDITNVRLYESQLHFTKNKTVKGNASITVTDDDGEILWTWWIWSTDKPEYYDKNGVWMMDRNLGATTTEISSPESFGLSFNPGNPFPFPGAKYNNFEITDIPSVPEGWYVADGYGFYTSPKKPTPQTPMMLCTDKNKYGNSVYYHDWLNPCPDNAYTPYWYDFINFIGDDPTVTPEALVGKEGYTIPCIYFTTIEQGEGRYLCRGQYNQTAVDTYVVYFYNEMAKYSYCVGADRLPIRAFSNMPPVGSLYPACLEVDGKGIVYVNGIDRTNSSFSINSEEIQEIYFSPNYGYEIEYVEVNGVDRTSELKDNLLILHNVTESVIIKAKFSALTVNLSFSLGEGGSVFIRSQFGEPQTIGFKVEDGWYLSPRWRTRFKS